LTLVLDTGPLVALADRNDPLGSRIEEFLREEPGELVLPAPVATEVDHVLGRRLGRGARLAFLDDLAAGRFSIACLEAGDHRAVGELERRYASLGAGLANLSIVVVAARWSTRRILTFDERHFRSLRPLDGGRFTLLPHDLDM